MPKLSKKLIYSFLVLFALLLSARAERNKCLALVLEGNKKLNAIGGGTKGAYEAGAFSGFADILSADDVKYDVISGNQH